MKIALAGLVLALGTTPALAQERPMPTSPAFEQLRPLVGEWAGQTDAGVRYHASYELVSGGTALLERLRMGDEPEMVTVYTPDGDQLAVTHFCSAGNQPRMRTNAASPSAKEYSFSFVGATNLATADAGHMDHLTLTLQDHDHYSQAWTWKYYGKSRIQMFSFTRKT